MVKTKRNPQPIEANNPEMQFYSFMYVFPKERSWKKITSINQWLTMPYLLIIANCPAW
jgi:hypothetical protein